MNQQKEKIVYVATICLGMVIMCMLGMFIYALTDPNIPDEQVLSIVGPSFQTIIGGFIGLITGIQVGCDDE
jgi:hypothetical protein